jgi:hypothetical protein
LEELLALLEKTWTTTLQEELNHLRDLLALEASAVQSLERQIPGTVQAYRKEFTPRIPGILGELPFPWKEVPLSQLSEFFALGHWARDTSPVSAHPLWIRALEQTLSPEQAATLANTDLEFQKTIPTLLERRKAPTVQLLQEHFRSLIPPIETTLNLPPERSKSLQELAAKAADSALQELLQSESHRLQSLPRAARKLLSQSNREIAPIWNPTFRASKDPFWKEGISKLISEEEFQKIEEHRASLLRSLADALHLTLLLRIDEACALTSSQREQLRPPLRAFLASQLRNFAETGELGTSNLPSPYEIHRLSDSIQRALPEESLRPWLDSTQLELWQTNRKLALARRQPGKPALPQTSEPTLAAPAAEQAESALADFLKSIAEKKRLELRSALTARCEDVIRVTNLLPEPARRLRLAATGTVEQTLRTALADTETQVREYVVRNPATDPRRALRSNNFYFPPQKLAPEKTPLWKNAVQNALSPEQLALWQQSTAAREAFRIEALCQVPLFLLEKTAGTLPEQRQSLASLLADTLRDYEPDIDSSFQFGDGQPWYMNGSISFVLLALLPEAELNKTLSPEQSKRWSTSSVFQAASANAERVRNAHQNRVKAANPAPKH